MAMAESFRLAVDNVCSLHDTDFTYYCPLHDDVLCTNCVKNEHQLCPQPQPMSEIARKSKLSLSAGLENNLRAMLENVKNALDHQRTTLAYVGEKESGVKRQIQDIRNRLNQWLSELEKDLLKSYSKEREEHVPRLQNNISILDKKKTEIENLRQNASKIKEFGSDIDYFLVSRDVSQKLLEEEEFVASIVEGLRGVKLDFSVNQDIDSFTSKITKIGNYSIKETSSNITLRRLMGVKKKPKRQNPMEEIKQVNVDEGVMEGVVGGKDIASLKLVLRNKFAMTKGFLKKDLCICDSIIIKEQIIFTDRENKRFIVTTIDGDHIHNMDVTGRPWGVAIIDEKRVAVTFPYIGSGYFEILDITNNTVEKAIQVGGLCRGVAYYKGHIYVVVFGYGIQIVDMEGNVKKSIPVNVNGVFHMAVDNEQMYYTDEWSNALHCRDLTGKPLWSFSDDRLRQPHGITTDDRGNVYVASYVFDSVIVISPDGRKCREILNKKHGLLGPSSLYFDRKNNFLLVSSRENGRVSLFHVM